MKMILTCLAVAAMSTGAVANTPRNEAKPVFITAAADAATRSGNSRDAICKRREATGSRLRGYTICATPDEWAEADRERRRTHRPYAH
jgi:hypothetical protein